MEDDETGTGAPGLDGWGEDNGCLLVLVVLGRRRRRTAVAAVDECECEIQHQWSHCSWPSNAAVELRRQLYRNELNFWDYEIGNLFIFQFANSLLLLMHASLVSFVLVRHEEGVMWKWRIIVVSERGIGNCPQIFCFIVLQGLIGIPPGAYTAHIHGQLRVDREI